MNLEEILMHSEDVLMRRIECRYRHEADNASTFENRESLAMVGIWSHTYLTISPLLIK